MLRDHRPQALATSPRTTAPPGARVDISADNTAVTAALPSGESVKVLLHGATVLGWTAADGRALLWLSEAADLAHPSQPVQGGIPLVFPIFGEPAGPAALPLHGFAHCVKWEFLGSAADDADAVRLDFGLTAAALPPATRALWPYRCGLVYSVTLARARLTTALVVTNDDTQPFGCHMLLHTYLRVDDIDHVEIAGLEGAPYFDKIAGANGHAAAAGPLTVAGAIDRVFSPPAAAAPAIVVTTGPGPLRLRITRQNLPDLVVYNPGHDGARALPDFEPKDGWRHMLAVEPGAVAAWQRLEPGDVWEGSQTLSIE